MMEKCQTRGKKDEADDDEEDQDEDEDEDEEVEVEEEEEESNLTDAPQVTKDRIVAELNQLFTYFTWLQDVPEVLRSLFRPETEIALIREAVQVGLKVGSKPVLTSHL